MKFKTLLLFSFLPCLLFADKRQLTAPPSKPKMNENLFNKDVPVFIVNGEFIYWNVQEGALDYALRMRYSETSSNFAQGDFERAEFDWDPGYRISAGYYRAENFWEIVAEYTALRVKGNDEIKSPPIESTRYINGTFPQINSSPMERATSQIHLRYQLANLLAHRVFHPFNNPHLRLRFSGGLTTAFIHQSWHVNYFQPDRTSILNHWRYWGMGMRIVTGFDWYWGSHFYMSGKFSTALVIGRYHNHAKQEAIPLIEPRSSLGDSRYKDYRVAYTTQFFAGPSYQRSFTKLRFEIFAGYELTTWGNLHEIYRSIASAPTEAKQTLLSRGLITLHGLTTRATINF